MIERIFSDVDDDDDENVSGFLGEIDFFSWTFDRRQLWMRQVHVRSSGDWIDDDVCRMDEWRMTMISDVDLAMTMITDGNGEEHHIQLSLERRRLLGKSSEATDIGIYVPVISIALFSLLVLV